MNVLSVMLDNQDVPQPNTKPLNLAILDADTEAYYSSDEDLHPFHEAPRTTPAARGAKKLSPQKKKVIKKLYHLMVGWRLVIVRLPE